MNRSGSHRNHENHESHLSEGSPPQGLSEARRGKEFVWDFFEDYEVLIRRGGVPSGAAGFIAHN
jgi:hypothetical protein